MEEGDQQRKTEPCFHGNRNLYLQNEKFEGTVGTKQGKQQQTPFCCSLASPTPKKKRCPQFCYIKARTIKGLTFDL